MLSYRVLTRLVTKSTCNNLFHLSRFSTTNTNCAKLNLVLAEIPKKSSLFNNNRNSVRLFSNGVIIEDSTTTHQDDNILLMDSSNNVNTTSSIITKNKQLAVNENVEDEFDEERFKQDLIWEMGPAKRPSYNFAPFANDSVILKKFIQLGVQVYAWEEHQDKSIPEFILKLDFNRDVAPIISFLCDNGVKPENLGSFITKNPFIFKETLQNLDIRINYLKTKKFSDESIARIIDDNPLWLSHSIKSIDLRLGFFQTYFKFRGNEIRELATTSPKLITYALWKVRQITFKLKEEMGFEPDQVKKLLKKHPKLWRINGDGLWSRFNYLHNEVGFTHEDLVYCPKLLSTREAKLRVRIGFLQKVKRAQFNPEKPNFISFEDIINKDDAHFAINVAKSSPNEFNDYLKSL